MRRGAWIVVGADNAISASAAELLDLGCHDLWLLAKTVVEGTVCLHIFIIDNLFALGPGLISRSFRQNLWDFVVAAARTRARDVEEELPAIRPAIRAAPIT